MVRDMSIFERKACLTLKINDPNIVENKNDMTYKEIRDRYKNKNECEEADYGKLDLFWVLLQL